MATISVCMIIKDEEKYLRNCLESIKDIADEIIVVDTGSEDRSKEIAREFTDKIFDFQWGYDFSDARNFSISKANCDWIFYIDADEVISKEDINLIKEMSEEKEPDAFVVKQRNYSNDIGSIGWISSKDDKYPESKYATGYVPFRIVRFFRNKKGYFFEGRIHETVSNSVKNKNGKIFDSIVVVHHLGKLDERNSRKKENYIALLKQRLDEKDFSEKTEDFICSEISGEFLELKKYDEAVEYLQKAIELNPNPTYMLSLGNLYLFLKKYDLAESLLKKSVAIDGNNPSTHSNLGVLYSDKEEFNKAIRKFERAIELNPQNADYFFNLGLVYFRMGKKNKAIPLFERAVELNPTYKEKVNFL